MNIIQQITSDARQNLGILLPDGTQFSLSIYFSSMQFGWFITNLTYQRFILNGVRITNSPNMLHQFRNQIPFGLACATASNREPSQAQDFSSGASILYLLDQADVALYTGYLNGQVRS